MKAKLTTSSFLKVPAVLASKVLRLDGALVIFVPSVRKRGTVLPAELPGGGRVWSWQPWTHQTDQAPLVAQARAMG